MLCKTKQQEYLHSGILIQMTTYSTDLVKTQKHNDLHIPFAEDQQTHKME